MNMQRFIISVIAVFVFIFAFNFVVHGHLLMPLYLQHVNLWRPMDQMMTMMPWDIGVQVALAIATAFLFTRHYEGKGLEEGLRYGFYIGVIMAVLQFDDYVYLPISLNLAIAWLATYLAEGLGIGAVLSLTYRA